MSEGLIKIALKKHHIVGSSPEEIELSKLRGEVSGTGYGAAIGAGGLGALGALIGAMKFPKQRGWGAAGIGTLGATAGTLLGGIGGAIYKLKNPTTYPKGSFGASRVQHLKDRIAQQDAGHIPRESIYDKGYVPREF